MIKKWISTETLPKESGYFLVFGNCTNDGLMIDIAFYDEETNLFHKSNQPTHYQLLPLPPQSIKKEQATKP
jgi:hypothetical protein